MAKQMSLIKNIDIGYFALKSKESLVITRKFENIFNLVPFHTSVIIVIVWVWRKTLSSCDTQHEFGNEAALYHSCLPTWVAELGSNHLQTDGLVF